jgi:hypothetical protein
MLNLPGLVVQVLNVGDGACTIARSDRDDRLTIIDCGTTTPAISGNPAATVRQALGLNLANLDTMVVTHFDADHWHGFRDLAPMYKEAIERAKNPPPPPKLIYAGMPRQVRKLVPAIHAFQALGSDSGVRPLDLREAWSATGVRLKTEVLFRGHTFQASGYFWDVLWPPRHLPDSVSSWIQSALDDVQELAKDMADKGDSSLNENLQEAYEIWSGLEPKQDEDREYREDESPSSEELWDFPALEIRQSDLKSRPPGGTPAGPYGRLPERHAKSFQTRFAKISKRLAAANNYLSLVVAQDRRFISFGDIKLNALTALLRLEAEKNDPRGNHYCISLAPHHGSHSIPARAIDLYPTACLCISQSGHKLFRHASKHFYRTKARPRHEALAHLYTHKSGVLVARPHGNSQYCQLAAHFGFSKLDFWGNGLTFP